MALRNVIDPELARPRLEDWFASRHPNWGEVRITGMDIPSANGMSSETILFDVTWVQQDGAAHDQELVARVAPSANGLLPSYDLAHEQGVLAAVRASTAVPVPTPHGVEADTSVLGGPFLIMDRLSGRVPGDDPPFTTAGWVTELSADQQSAMYDNALAAMAAITATDIAGLGSETVGQPASDAASLAQQLDHYERLYAWTAAGRAHPVLDDALEWTRANLPDGEAPAGLSWGDARLGNMMFGETSPSPACWTGRWPRSARPSSISGGSCSSTGSTPTAWGYRHRKDFPPASRALLVTRSCSAARSSISPSTKCSPVCGPRS